MLQGKVNGLLILLEQGLGYTVVVLVSCALSPTRPFLAFFGLGAHRDPGRYVAPCHVPGARPFAEPKIGQHGRCCALSLSRHWPIGPSELGCPMRLDVLGAFAGMSALAVSRRLGRPRSSNASSLAGRGAGNTGSCRNTSSVRHAWPDLGAALVYTSGPIHPPAPTPASRGSSAELAPWTYPTRR